MNSNVCNAEAPSGASACEDAEHGLPMAAALLTLTSLSILGIGVSFVLAFQPATMSHVGIAVFATMLNLLAHSFMMFYLIGKGKAVREAVEEAGLEGDYYRRVARLRAPVFARATIAMALLMAAAIIGASVDVRVLPPWPHALLAAAAVAANLATLVSEVAALTGSARVVDEVNQRLSDAHG
jgi:hypothetical protein